MMSRAQVLKMLPTVSPKNLAGGVRYFDAQFDDARMAIALMKTLHQLGGMAVNYCQVNSLVKQGDKVAGVKIRDMLGPTAQADITLHAKVIINATGVWVDQLRTMDNPRCNPLLSPSQGVHIVVDQSFYPAHNALLIPRTSDGRVLFVIPWLGKTLIGTTDTLRSDIPLEPEPLKGEVAFILKTAGQYLSKPPCAADITSVFVGLRPLVSKLGKQSTKSISREHTIITEPSGLVTITGGKWTTYRSMAEEVVDLVIEQHGFKAGCTKTRDLRLQDTWHGNELTAPRCWSFQNYQCLNVTSQ